MNKRSKNDRGSKKSEPRYLDEARVREVLLRYLTPELVEKILDECRVVEDAPPIAAETVAFIHEAFDDFASGKWDAHPLKEEDVRRLHDDFQRAYPRDKGSDEST